MTNGRHRGSSTDAEGFDALDELIEPTRVERPSRAGRYELVWELGAGGMASVFLARARGPGGFHRWFAIKRIHAHLAKDPRFVQMFFDEARIAAALCHPNVSQVFEIGDEAGEPFLAMEYLHGEHLGAFAAHALKARGGLDPVLAARVVATAAHGLHHAHEASDEHGAPLGLVHRDVSPQNIFVGYDGTVKITDFGIAKAAGRLTHTQTGGLKGKVSYMAPEQALGTALDRRADVWGLGVVLWECTTGKRLFRAPTDAQTLLRITSGRVAPPSSVARDYPPQLERIVMRALAMKPDDRWPSALEVARALEAWIAGQGRPSGAAEISALAHEIFSDRIATKDTILRTGTGTGEPVVATHALTEGSQSRVVTRATTKTATRSRGARLGVALVAAVALAVGIVATALWMGTGTPAEAIVRIDTDPAGAVVSLDGVRQRGTTPQLVEHVPFGPHRLTIERTGFQRRTERFRAAGRRIDLSFTLVSQVIAPRSAPAIPGQLPSPPPALPVPSPEIPRARQAGTPARAHPPSSPSSSAAPAYLNLIARPWARVWLRGRVLGATPLLHRVIPSGDVTLTLRAFGTGPPHALHVRAAPGETVSRSVDLR